MNLLPIPFACVLLSATPVVAEQATSPGIDLLASCDGWTSWSPRPEIAPQFRQGVGLEKQPVLEVSGGGNPDACGGWRRPLPVLHKGRRYRIEAAFQQQSVAAPGHCIWALTIQGGKEYEELDYVGRRDGWGRMSLELAPEKDLQDLSLGLFLAWSAEGRVRWTDVRLTDITDRPVKLRIVRLAAISGRPQNPKSVADCIDFYCDRLDEAGAEKADLAVLPEVINSDVIRTSGANPSEPIPGPSTQQLAEKARQHRMFIAASLVEREGPRLYNTGVLLDRSGSIVGKYRKTHLTIGEGLLSGKRPGDTYPVFDTELGRIGYMICYDNHYPEVSRILAVQGAEILVFSNMSDGREKSILWEPYMQTRALDNNVHIAAAVNGGGSCIVSPRGEMLSMSDQSPGSMAIAECDLDQSVRSWTGRPIDRRYLRVRRAETFEPLTRHLWDTVNDTAAPQ